MFLNKKRKNTRATTQKKQNYKRRQILQSNPEALAEQSGALPSATESTEHIHNDCIQAFNCFNVMHRNINKQNQIYGPHLFNKNIIVCTIYTDRYNYIWQFLIFTGVGFTAELLLKSKMKTLVVENIQALHI